VFKNVRLFRLDDPASVDADRIEERLAERRFRPCGPLETATLGWAPPLGDGATALSHLAGDCLLVCARRQERLLPASVVAESLDEKIAEMEDREARTVGRKERRQLRDEVMLDLLPRAFTRSRRVCVAGTSPSCRGRKFFSALPPSASSMRLDEFHQLHRLVVADVVHAVGCPAGGGVGAVLDEGRIGRGRPVEHAHHALGDVVDVGEVALHLAVVEHVDRLARRGWPW
jgi:hypothetical protein